MADPKVLNWYQRTFLQEGNAIKHHFKCHKEFLGLLFMAIHLSAGVPAQASESATLLLINTGDHPRSVLFTSGALFTAYLCYSEEPLE